MSDRVFTMPDPNNPTGPADASTSESAQPDIEKDPAFQRQVQQLHRLTVYGRWLTVGLLWIGIAPCCLWNLRSEIALWLDYFTWTALRYGLAYHRLAAVGLALCIGATVAVLLWQSRNILIGIPPEETRYLERQVIRIRQQGKSHPLWRWVCKD
jgi:hypothetical protein